MRGLRKLATIGIALLGIGGVLSGCANFDPESFDFFGLNEKKKLPGERRPVFPEGIPGVSQGIPPELIKGRQPQPSDAAVVEQTTAEPQPQTETKPKPKPRVATRPARISVSPSQPKPAAETQQQSGATTPQQTQQTGTNAPWPDPTPQQSSPSPWPSAPAPGTFQR